MSIHVCGLDIVHMTLLQSSDAKSLEQDLVASMAVVDGCCGCLASQERCISEKSCELVLAL